MHDYGISRLYLHFHPLATISLCYISTRFLGTHIYTERGHATLPLIFFYLYTFVFVLICLYSCSFCLPQPAVSRLWSRRRRAVARLGWKKRRQPASDFLFLLCNRGWYRRCQKDLYLVFSECLNEEEGERGDEEGIGGPSWVKRRIGGYTYFPSSMIPKSSLFLALIIYLAQRTT